MRTRHTILQAAGYLIAALALSVGPVKAGPLSLFSPEPNVLASPGIPGDAVTEDTDDVDTATPLRPDLRRQVVNYPTRAAPGTIIIDTPHTFLYYVLGDGKAIRYGIGVGREGFTWAGTETVSRMAEWPDWYPPQEMIARQPYLPRFMAGGTGNPLGARAIYLGNTMYRIHGTNAPDTIGHKVSSGCIRLLNEDVMDLYRRVNVGTKVIVLPSHSNGALRSASARHHPAIRVSASSPQ
jgi:lipoprotein-anchoring transpeptidase ErfK/SrfK